MNKLFTNPVRTLADKDGCSAHFIEYNSLEDPFREYYSTFSILFTNNFSNERKSIWVNVQFKPSHNWRFYKEIDKLDPEKSSIRT